MSCVKFKSKYNVVDISCPFDWTAFPAASKTECDEFDSPSSAYLIVCQEPVFGATSAKAALNVIAALEAKAKPPGVSAFHPE